MNAENLKIFQSNLKIGDTVRTTLSKWRSENVKINKIEGDRIFFDDYTYPVRRDMIRPPKYKVQ